MPNLHNNKVNNSKPTNKVSVVKSKSSNKVTAAASIVGPQGPVGPQGARGPTGAQGQQGAAGPTGPQGIGINGTNGTNGAAGPQGAAGLQGQLGPAGPQGAKGNAGTNGLNGPQGAAGPQGPLGPVGPAGQSTAYLAGVNYIGNFTDVSGLILSKIPCYLTPSILTVNITNASQKVLLNCKTILLNSTAQSISGNFPNSGLTIARGTTISGNIPDNNFINLANNLRITDISSIFTNKPTLPLLAVSDIIFPNLGTDVIVSNSELSINFVDTPGAVGTYYYILAGVNFQDPRTNISSFISRINFYAFNV